MDVIFLYDDAPPMPPLIRQIINVDRFSTPHPPTEDPGARRSHSTNRQCGVGGMQSASTSQMFTVTSVLC